MKRREFLQRSGMAVVAVITARFLTACGGGGGGSSTPANSFVVTSTVIQGHQHTINVIRTDLSAPPVGGVTYTSSAPITAYIDAHTHTVALTSQQLTDLNSGLTVTLTSSSATTGTLPAHTHDFSIVKA